jgi:hypothetical protein
MNELLAVEGLKVTLNGIEPQLTKEKPNYDFSEKAVASRKVCKWEKLFWKFLTPSGIGQKNLRKQLFSLA